MGLRVMVVDAFLSDKDGRQQFKVFLRLIGSALKAASCITDFHLTVRGVDDLSEFIYDRNENNKTQRQALRNFTSIDITFIGGDETLVPWNPSVARLLAYLNQCMISQSCVFGDKLAARCLWHLACVHGRQLNVVDVLGRGGLAPADVDDDDFPLAFAGRHAVMLQEVSGEAFQLDDSPLCNASDDRSEASDNIKIRAAGVHVRCCNVGLRRRIPGISVVDNSVPRDTLKLTQSRGLEKHWLMPKIKSGDASFEQRPIRVLALTLLEYKCDRVWDLNSSLAQARPDVNAVAPLGGLSEQGFLESFAKHTRSHSATCRQPDRTVHVLASSQYGPEMVECGHTLTFNFSVKPDSKFIRTLFVEFCKHYAELLSGPDGKFGEQDRRDASYEHVMKCKPLMDRFHLPPEVRSGEFGGRHPETLRQLEREGVMPAAEVSAGDTFVSLPKIHNAKFERKGLHTQAKTKIVHPVIPRAGSTDSVDMGDASYGIERTPSDVKLSKLNRHLIQPHAPRDSPREEMAGEMTAAAKKPVRRMYVTRHPFTNYEKLQRQAEEMDERRSQFADPYTSSYERQLQEKNEQRKHWMSPTNFTVVACTANPPIKPIPPTINLTPWPGPPAGVFQKIVASSHNYPKTEWVSQKGMRFNFSVKSPSEKDMKKKGQSKRLHAVAHRS